MDNCRLLRVLALLACFFALGVIALGAFTRLIDAGLGCPDWPGCYGQFVVPLTDKARDIAIQYYPATPLVAYKAWAEMIHRYAVGGLSIFIVSIIILIFSKKRLRIYHNIMWATILLVLLSYQIILGKWTVTMKLLPIVVSQHLLGGFAILSVLWLIYLTNQPISAFVLSIRQKLLPWAMLMMVILLGQISLGAWTSTHYASLSCPDFPFCMNDSAVFSWHFSEAFNLLHSDAFSDAVKQTIQMTHRFGALIFTGYLLVFTWLYFARLKNFPKLLNGLYGIWGLLCLQLCIGMINVMFKLPLISAISHTLVAALLLLAVIAFIHKIAVASQGSAG